MSVVLSFPCTRTIDTLDVSEDIRIQLSTWSSYCPWKGWYDYIYNSYFQLAILEAKFSNHARSIQLAQILSEKARNRKDRVRAMIILLGEYNASVRLEEGCNLVVEFLESFGLKFPFSGLLFELSNLKSSFLF